jgi:hypothetical protein
VHLRKLKEHFHRHDKGENEDEECLTSMMDSRTSMLASESSMRICMFMYVKLHHLIMS